MAKRWWTIGLILVQLLGLLAIPGQAAAYGTLASASTANVWRPINGTGLPPLGSLLVNVIVADPTNPKAVYLGTSQSYGLYGGVYRTLDGGTTWTSINTGLPTGADIDLLAISPDGSMLYARNSLYASLGLFRAPTGDVHWTQLSTSTCCSADAIFSLYVDATYVYLGDYDTGIYKSGNHGDSWVHLVHSPQNNALNVIAGVSTNPNLLYTGSAGIFQTLDGGDTWNPVNGYNLVNCAAGYAVTIAIDPADTDVVLAGDNNTCLERSEDGGITWNSVYENVGVSHVVFDPQFPDQAYLVGIHSGTFHDGVMKSSDNGQTWVDYNGGLPTWDIGGFALGPAGVGRPAVLYVSMPNKGIYATSPANRTYLPIIMTDLHL